MTWLLLALAALSAVAFLLGVHLWMALRMLADAEEDRVRLARAIKHYKRVHMSGETWDFPRRTPRQALESQMAKAVKNRAA